MATQLTMEGFIANKKNAINHFMNEQIRDAVEILEGKTVSDVAIFTHGKISQYQDGTREFSWKGKVAIVLRLELSPQGMEIVAYHTYDNNKRLTLEEFNNEV